MRTATLSSTLGSTTAPASRGVSSSSGISSADSAGHSGADTASRPGHQDHGGLPGTYEETEETTRGGESQRWLRSQGDSSRSGLPAAAHQTGRLLLTPPCNHIAFTVPTFCQTDTLLDNTNLGLQGARKEHHGKIRRPINRSQSTVAATSEPNRDQGQASEVFPVDSGRSGRGSLWRSVGLLTGAVAGAASASAVAASCGVRCCSARDPDRPTGQLSCRL